MKTVERIVAFCCRWPLTVIALSLLLAAGGAWYTTQNFAMNTDSEQLIDAKVGWRMRQARFDAAFPQKTNLTAVVIDGKTPELAESAAARLTEKLAANPALYMNVRRPDGGTFFNQNGLLFLSLDEVRDTTQQLIKAQPFLGGLANDPSLRGIMTNLNTVLLGVGAGEARLADIDRPMARFADVFGAAAQGKTDFMSWRSLITGAPARPEEIRRFIEVKAKLNFNALEPGAEASNGIRAAARALNLDFAPLAHETYELIIPRAHYESERLQPLLALVHDPAFRAAVAAMPGYDVGGMGNVRLLTNE